MTAHEEQTPLLPQHKADPYTTDKRPCCASRHRTDSQCCSKSMDNQEYCYLADQPWQMKAVALMCALLLAVGSHFAAHTLGAMKNTIKEEFGITNSQYGVIQSSVSIVNTVLPVIGGIFLDAFGTAAGSIITTVLITSGNIFVAASTSNASLSMMLIGRILYGIGSGTVVIVQETILSQWFKGRSLAGVMALMLTVSRLASFLAQATVMRIAKWTGWYGYGFWFCALLCLFSLVVNLIYLALLRAVYAPTATCEQQQEVIRRKKTFKWSKLLYLPHSYWLIAAMEFLLGGGWGCFLHINSEFVKMKFGYDNVHAAATASVAQIAPVFLMPILGLCLDKYGKRTWMMIGSGLSFLFSMIFLQYTSLSPLLGMVMFSLSLSLGPVGLVSSVPIILPLSLVGTGMGLIKSGTNIGATLFDIFTGLLQDADAHKGYDDVMDFFIGVSALAVLAGVTLWILNHTLYDNVLDRSARAAVIAGDGKSSYDNTSLKKLKSNYFYGGLFITLCVLSWILFFKFVLFP